MLCGSPALAHLDWLCNGSRRFISPTGVANHRRQETLGGGGLTEAKLHQWPSHTRPAHQACSLTPRFMAWHGSSHTCKHAHSHMTLVHTHGALYASFNATAVLGGCAELPPRVLAASVLHVWQAQADAHNSEPETEKWICRWPKITIRMKRKRGCVSNPPSCFEQNWMEDEKENGREGKGNSLVLFQSLLGLFHLTKASALQSFASQFQVSQTYLGQTVKSKRTRIKNKQRLKTCFYNEYSQSHVWWICPGHSCATSSVSEF